MVSTVSYQKALEIIQRSHTALLFAPDLPYQIPANVYDYMGSGTKVLTLAEEGATANLVNSPKTGESLGANDTEGIAEFICQFVKEMESGNSQTNRLTEEYRIEAISRKFAKHLYKVQGLGSLKTPCIYASVLQWNGTRRPHIALFPKQGVV